MTTYTVSSGVTSNGLVLSFQDTENVLAGGIATNTTVNSGGIENVSSGGTVSDTVINDGGNEYVYSGGVANATTVNSGGALYDSGTTTGTILDASGAVNSAIENVYFGATAVSTTITSGGIMTVLSGGTATDTVISGGSNAGALYVSSGGSSLNATITDGNLYDSGTTTGTTLIVSYERAYGTAVSTTISSGGKMTVFSGGTATDTTVSSGGTENVNSGGVASNTIVQSGGTATVSSGGTLSGGTISDGSLNVSGTTITGAGLVVDGGTAIGVTAIGATPAGDTGDSVIYVTSGGVISNSVLESARQLVVGATAIGTIVSSGGEDDVQSGGTTINDVVSSGGLEALLAGGVASNTTVGAGGFTYVFSASTATGTTISSGGVLDILSGGSATDTILNVGGTIDVGYVPYAAGATAALNSSTDVLTVTDGSNTLTYQMSGSYNAGDTFLVSNDSNNGTQITLTPCFRAGTGILTDRGEILVERLAPGDHVMTADGTPRPIKWIGHRSLDLSRHPEPELVRPVLIRAGAIGDNAPHRDLYVSPDHALLLDGVLVPARLLVNGASIQTVSTCKAVTYYHVELNTHDILLAENLPAESYLDTGNRAMFENTGLPMLLHPDLGNDQSRRVIQSCRPFADDPAVVEPIWRRLASRSTQLGMPLPAATETTRNPDLRVVIDGTTVKPVSVHGERYIFVLPPVCSAIHLVSRSAKPCDVRPWVEDRRQLGVMISCLTVKRGTVIEEIPLDLPQLANGWWAAEHDQATLWRWTNGDAVIPVSGNGTAVLEVTLRETQDYPVNGRATATLTVSSKAA